VGAAKCGWIQQANLNCPLFGFPNLILINVTMLRRFSELDLIIASFDVIAEVKLSKWIMLGLVYIGVFTVTAH
jgi:hypothetical protein